MKSSSSETDEDPLRAPRFEVKHYFENWESISAVFAGSPVLNQKKLQERLSVSLTARDTWILLSSDTQERLDRAEAFLKELVKIQMQLSGSRVLDQRDFDMTLNAYAESRENEIQNYFTERIKVGARKHEIVPRTPTQYQYVRQMRQKDIVFGIGPAGTGKTYLAMAMAVSELLAGHYDRIVLTRPAVEAGENLGFLPGNLEEKINPYLRPLYDALYDMLEFAEAQSFIEKNIIEVAPLAFMRGRTLNHAFIILDEAQNATNEQMLMFLTRLGFNSKCIVAGDPTQTDLPARKISGLMNAVRRLTPIDEIAVCRFTSADVVRHSLVEKIINAYQEKRNDIPEPCPEKEGENNHV